MRRTMYDSVEPPEYWCDSEVCEEEDTEDYNLEEKLEALAYVYDPLTVYEQSVNSKY